MSLTLASLFDGIGGFPLAFARAGVRTVATVEIDKAAAAISRRHFPDAHQFDDVTKVTGVNTPVVAPTVTAKWAKGTGGPAGDEAQNLVVTPEASTQPYNALRAGDGGSSRQSLVAITSSETVVRRLTELECERLQGYPDQYTDGQSGSARYRQLGNSVAVPNVEWVARRLVAVDRAVAESLGVTA